ncbi:MAG: efflux RND transporter periplasmic adaptor subunit [Acidobacteria bacterium]|nr:efflux RND transporter periplasmic adaptor subunit [Acidobacteriota bacterium]
MAGRMSRIGWIGLSVLLLAAACGGNKQAVAEKQAAVPVSVVSVKEMAFDISEERTGEIVPVKRAIVVPTVGGVITAMKADIGDSVKAGQVLAVVDHRAVNQQLASIRGAMGAVEAKLSLLQADAARFQRLYEQDAVSKHRLESIQAELKATAETKKQLKGQYDALKARLADYYVKSPINGQVSMRALDAGSVAGGGKPLFVVDDLKQVKVLSSVGEKLLPLMKKGAAAIVSIPALNRKLKAVVNAVSSSLDPATRSGKVEILLDNKDGSIRPGMFCKVKIIAGSDTAPAVDRDGLLRLPATGVYYCFTVGKDNRAVKRMLKLGRIQGNVQEVLSGLDTGDKVVIRGMGLLKTGTPVSIVK